MFCGKDPTDVVGIKMEEYEMNEATVPELLQRLDEIEEEAMLMSWDFFLSERKYSDEEYWNINGDELYDDMELMGYDTENPINDYPKLQKECQQIKSKLAS